MVSACETLSETGSSFGPSNFNWKLPPRTPRILIFDSNFVNDPDFSLLTTPSLRQDITRKVRRCSVMCTNIWLAQQEARSLDVPVRCSA